MIHSDSLLYPPKPWRRSKAIANKTALQKYISLGFSDTVNDIASFHQGLLKQACHWLPVVMFLADVRRYFYRQLFGPLLITCAVFSRRRVEPTPFHIMYQNHILTITPINSIFFCKKIPLQIVAIISSDQYDMAIIIAMLLFFLCANKPKTRRITPDTIRNGPPSIRSN
jgi:hypothetical protein